MPASASRHAGTHWCADVPGSIPGDGTFIRRERIGQSVLNPSRRQAILGGGSIWSGNNNVCGHQNVEKSLVFIGFRPWRGQGVDPFGVEITMFADVKMLKKHWFLKGFDRRGNWRRIHPFAGPVAGVEITLFAEVKMLKNSFAGFRSSRQQGRTHFEWR